ncbi:MAG: DUF2764 family protein [Bacteroidaceae bacterium]|nr:DUF2764 family protein [Bacteroidaceae bacterium]
MGNYYCQVAGLPDISFDGSKLQYSTNRFKDELYPALTSEDASFVDLLFLSRDNANLLELLRKGEDAVIADAGCFTADELKEIISSAKNGDAQPGNVPAYLYGFLEYYFGNEGQERILWDDVLASRYYEYASRSANSFVSSWFEFNRNVNNILVAMAARKYKMSVADAVVGDGEVAEALRTSGARDFGLTGTLDYLEIVQRISEESNLLERERKLDELRWKWLDDNSVFNYFTVERLFVFLVKVGIVERWSALDADKGMQRYNTMINNLKGGADLNSAKKE